MRSLLKRFCSKVATIEEHQDLNFLTVEELVGNLQTFESNHCQIKKGKDIALLSSNSVDETENSDSSSDIDDAKFEAYLARKFKKMWKNKNAFSKRILRHLQKETLYPK